MLKRAVNEGFSGGEKKRNEILQMMLLEPRLAILDETDSGLDIDALKVVAGGINAMRHPERAIVLVTHYQRLLDYVEPDRVHVLVGGSIVRSGTKELGARTGATRLLLARAACGGGNMSALLAEQNIYATQFSEIVDRLPGRGLDWLDHLRKNSIERFVQLGFPTTRLEDWKYTNVSAIARRPFQNVPTPSQTPGS